MADYPFTIDGNGSWDGERVPGTSHNATSFARIVDRLPPGRYLVELVKEDAPPRMSEWLVNILPVNQQSMVLRRTDD